MLTYRLILYTIALQLSKIASDSNLTSDDDGFDERKLSDEAIKPYHTRISEMSKSGDDLPPLAAANLAIKNRRGKEILKQRAQLGFSHLEGQG